MSLLEDVFLENEAGEAQELERIIEGDDNDERILPDSNENSEKEDEAEEDRRHVDPTSAKPKRIVKNPRVILNPARLTGPRGIQIIPDHFKDFKFKGKSHEKDDLDVILKKLEHWAYRLYPKFEFKDCLKKIETLGNKRPVMVHLTKIRTDQFMSEDTVVQRDSSDDEAPPAPQEDEFDRLLRQQIELARATPAPESIKKSVNTPVTELSHIMPRATSSLSINDEQRERMIRNRQLAEERRLARLKNNNSQNSVSIFENSVSDKVLEDSNNKNVCEDAILTETYTNTSENRTTENISNIMKVTEVKNNRSNRIDSSDDDELVINNSVAVDVHVSRNLNDNINYQNESKQNKSHEDIHQHNNKEHKYDKEERSDIDLDQNENDHDSSCDANNSINISSQGLDEIHTVSQEIEINNITHLKESINGKATDNTESNSVEEIATNKTKESSESYNSFTVVGKEINQKEQNVSITDESNKKTQTIKNCEEITMAMDVDFDEIF